MRRKARIEQEVEVIRVDGGALCPACGAEYRKHRWDANVLDFSNGQPFLRIGCDGKRLKL